EPHRDFTSDRVITLQLLLQPYEFIHNRNKIFPSFSTPSICITSNATGTDQRIGNRTRKSIGNGMPLLKKLLVQIIGRNVEAHSPIDTVDDTKLPTPSLLLFTVGTDQDFPYDHKCFERHH